MATIDQELQKLYRRRDLIEKALDQNLEDNLESISIGGRSASSISSGELQRMKYDVEAEIFAMERVSRGEDPTMGVTL